ncbi:MAG: NepR family anti-sigma factor [Rubrimonas sp.]
MLGESKTGKRKPGAVEAQADGGDPGRPARRRRDAALPDPLAANLRAVFSAVESEPVPDRFRDLLDRLAQEERK